MMKFKLFLLLLALVLHSWFPIQSESDGIGEWQLLTKQNHSSQIRLHPHILLFVTVPWSGESRTLMKEATHFVAKNVEDFGSLKLMFMHKIKEKKLANSIGAATEDEITILYYHYSISYKYRGRLRAKNILHSLYHYMSTAPEELPLKSLKTPEELKTFIDSTDKALILLEFCGWTEILQKKGMKNGTENGFSVHGDLHGVGFSGGAEGMVVTRRNNNLKVAGEEVCTGEANVNKEFSEVPWLWEFTSVNDSASFEAENRNPHDASACTYGEFQRFHSFYSKFMTAVREFFLPPERYRYGFVSQRSMLSSLSVGDSASWLVLHYLAGCPSCSKVLQEEDNLNYILQMDNPVAKELEGDGHYLAPSLPENKPSVLLFVDRSSDSPETRWKCKEALIAFRELAHYYQISHQTCNNNNNNDKHEKQGLKTTSGHPKLKLSLTSQKIKLKEKISTITVINEGKHVSLDKVTSDVQVSSLQEILHYLLQQKKDGKLSSLAKELGFQLLSDDIDIKPENILQSDQMSPETPKNGLLTNVVNQDDNQLRHRQSYPSGQPEENSKFTGVELSSQQDEVKNTYVATREEPIAVESKKFGSGHEDSVAKNIEVEEVCSSLGEKLEEELLQLGFNGSFFFSDGNYRFLRALTGGSRIPSVVIVDPLQQQHYVFPEDKTFSYSLLSGFLSEFLNGSLLPYQQSEYVLQSPRDATYPPFVNLDFHEMDPIPRVTAHSFSELVIGFNVSDHRNAYHAWSKDVLVIFSNSWCGFCHRMELVVRELYRAITGYMNLVKRGSRNGKTISSHDKLKDPILKLPLIYTMDCTLNECGLILKSIEQREVYPTLVLFPAHTKLPILYEGDMAVAEIIKFVADHGSNSHHLVNENVYY
ncbi:Protein disulfide-isomerase [Quillaja saponaria]|uniref:Protein disulfide-isomerase n=1 Tax=Quillaja saponaria TaxID=32244 RepID=A0AAD7KP71_QUISA|nr:Protein disulfide-isomerase [Quillaja saponaria]